MENGEKKKEVKKAEKRQLSITEILSEIQQDLKAPKGQFNSFGGYKFRSCEDIVEAIKPLAAKYSATIIATDDLVQIGERYYIKATVGFFVGSESVTAVGWAREAEAQKGMNDSQLTGAASSYARKYALNGLFAIDDTKDADSTNTHGKEQSSVITKDQLGKMLDILDNLSNPNEKKKKFAAFMKVESLEEIKADEFGRAMAALEASKKASKKQAPAKVIEEKQIELEVIDENN